MALPVSSLVTLYPYQLHLLSAAETRSRHRMRRSAVSSDRTADRRIQPVVATVDQVHRTSCTGGITPIYRKRRRRLRQRVGGVDHWALQARLHRRNSPFRTARTRPLSTSSAPPSRGWAGLQRTPLRGPRVFPPASQVRDPTTRSTRAPGTRRRRRLSYASHSVQFRKTWLAGRSTPLRTSGGTVACGQVRCRGARPATRSRPTSMSYPRRSTTGAAPTAEMWGHQVAIATWQYPCDSGATATLSSLGAIARLRVRGQLLAGTLVEY